MWGAGWASSVAERLAALVQCRLEKRWYEVQRRTPQGETWYLVGDIRVKEALFSLVEVAQACQDRCSECVEAGEPMSEEEVSRFLAEADENLNKMLERMDEAQGRVVGWAERGP